MPISAFKPLAMKLAEVEKSVAPVLKFNLLLAEELSTESDSDIQSDRFSEVFSKTVCWREVA